MRIDHEAKTIAVRQSWLDTSWRCPEEGRLAVAAPEWESYDTDEALVGTLAHAGFEAVVRGHVTPENIGDAIRDAGHAYNGVLRYTKPKYKDMGDIIDMAVRCGHAWVKEIMPHAPLDGAHSEVNFKIPVFEHRGYTVLISGTIDLVPTIPELWDWKTTGDDRRFDPKKKQKWAIQPTIYAMAAVSGLLPHAATFTYPVTFRYGVVVKRQGECKTVITTVTRDESHVSWATKRIKTMIDLALDFGFDKPWPQIDEQNFLCSETWCAWYPICKGAHQSDASDVPPSQKLPIPTRRVVVEQ